MLFNLFILFNLGILLFVIINIINSKILKHINLVFIIMLIYAILLFIDVSMYLYNNTEIIVVGNSSDYISFMNNNQPGTSTNVNITPTSGSIPTSDPVRWWPSGVPQTWAVIGSGLLTYKTLAHANPRARAMAALAATGASTSLVILSSALENAVGFNRLMFGMTEYNRTGRWPSIEEINSKFSDQAVNTRLQEAIDAYNSKGTGPGPVSSSLSSEQNPIIEAILKILENIPDNVTQLLASFFKAHSVAGHLDDLLGQQLFILICLFFLMFFIILLFIVYIINNVFLHYKDVLLNYFDNKYIKLYINYQVFLGKISIIYLPIIIIFFMLGLCKGLLFLITHTIPFENLDIDLHTFMKRN